MIWLRQRGDESAMSLHRQHFSTDTLSVNAATQLATTALHQIGYSDEDAETIADHIIDSELRGYPSAGLARILSIKDRVGTSQQPDSNIEVTRESAISAQLNGHNTIGYLVAHKATQMAIDKARVVGMAAVGVSGTWYTGMLSYYAEMAAREDLFCIVAAHTAPWVAPEGGFQPLLGTNPICIGCPSSSTPIIWDIGTSKIINAQARMARRINEQLPEDVAYDKHGNPTRDPSEALEGAFAVWGGHKGTGLSIMIQLIGVLAGSPAIPASFGAGPEDNGHFMIVIDPTCFRSLDEFKTEVDSYATAMRAATPREGISPLRMPFERSDQLRRQALKAGTIEIEKRIVELLRDFVG